MADCLFCSIILGDVPSEKVYESESVLAFKDINPGAPVHALFIPKEHVASAAELTAVHADALAEIFVAMAAHAREQGLDDGYRVVTNVGPAAGQSVAHLHFHLLGGRSLSWPPG